MPSVIVAVPPYPFVLPYPGVPPLPVPPGGLSLVPPVFALTDVSGLPTYIPPPIWGIFDAYGNPLITTDNGEIPVDSVYSIDYARDYQISDYPQEQGAFQSYNKVQQPYQAKINFLIAQSRYDFLNNIEVACGSLQLVSVVMPELQYASANLTHYAFHREARSGVTLIRVEVWCVEVRVTAGSALFPNSAIPPSPATTATNNTYTTTYQGQQYTVTAPNTETAEVVTAGFGPSLTAQSLNATSQSNDGAVQPQSPIPGSNSSGQQPSQSGAPWWDAGPIT
jgi:hypothetical protein